MCVLMRETQRELKLGNMDKNLQLERMQFYVVMFINLLQIQLKIHL